MKVLPGTEVSTSAPFREAGVKDDWALFWPKFRGDGWLEPVRGNRFHWKAMNFWGTAWGFFDAKEALLFALKPGVENPRLPDFLKTQAVVELAPQGRGLSELPLLLMLGWCLMILLQGDSAAEAAATTAAIG